MKVSKKCIISIWEFMENYFDIVYDGNFKLTHNEMCYYLKNEKNIFIRRLGFNDINNAMILCGDVVLIRDEEGKVVPYVNPKRICDLDLEDINSCKKSGLEIDKFSDLKEIGRKDFISHVSLNEKVLPKKKRVLRRKYK